MNNTETKLRICTKCGNEYPATMEYFKKEKNTKLGLTSICKYCRKLKYDLNIESIRKESRTYYLKNRTKIIEKSKAYAIDHREERRVYSKKWRMNNKKKIKEYSIANKEELNLKRKKYVENNRDRLRIQKRQTKQNNKEKVLEYQRSYYKNNKDIYRIDRMRRKSKKKGLTTNFKREDWRKCKEFFNNTCAYCGNGELKLTQDHLAPLTKGGDYTVNNIIPACSSCNSQKNNKDFEKWYLPHDKYSADRLDRILQYIKQFTLTSEQSFIMERNISGTMPERNGTAEQ